MRHTRRWARGARAAGAIVLAAALLAGVGAPARAAPRPLIGVADFYSLQPTPIFLLFDPQPYAADVAAGVLIRAGGPAVTVLPRGETRAVERKLGWHPNDVLTFSRLQALGQAIQADRLVTGWITRIAFSRVDFALFDATVSVTTQVFDTQQGRIVWQRETYGYGTAGSADFALQIALDRAVAEGVRAAVPVVSAPVERVPPPSQ